MHTIHTYSLTRPVIVFRDRIDYLDCTRTIVLPSTTTARYLQLHSIRLQTLMAFNVWQLLSVAPAL